MAPPLASHGSRKSISSRQGLKEGGAWSLGLGLRSQRVGKTPTPPQRLPVTQQPGLTHPQSSEKPLQLHRNFLGLRHFS